MDVNTERDNWKDVTPADATDAELQLVHKIFGPKPEGMDDANWRNNMRGCAKDIREHCAQHAKPVYVVDLSKVEQDILRRYEDGLVRHLRAHIAVMAPHQKERYGGKLLIEATDEIQRLREALGRIITVGYCGSGVASRIAKDALIRHRIVNTMKLDRNTNPNGLGKYALISVRKLSQEQIAQLTDSSAETHTIPAGAIDLGLPCAVNLGLPSAQGKGGFFVLRYQDRFAEAALRAYADAVFEEYERTGNQELLELCGQVNEQADIARDHEPKKIPD